jgi:hypothetical protein
LSDKDGRRDEDGVRCKTNDDGLGDCCPGEQTYAEISGRVGSE